MRNPKYREVKKLAHVTQPENEHFWAIYTLRSDVYEMWLFFPVIS